MDAVHTMNKASRSVESKLKECLANPYIMSVLKISLALYAAQLAPRLPDVVTKVFSNTVVKIFTVAIIAYLANVDFQLAIIISIVFVLGSNVLSGRSFSESYDNTTVMMYEDQGVFSTDENTYTDLLGKPAQVNKLNLIDSQTDNYSGCDGVTLEDLLDIFNGDKSKMQSTVREGFRTLMQSKSSANDKLVAVSKAAGLPYNIELNDKNAPLIATILLNHGFVITKKCSPPGGEDMFQSTETVLPGITPISNFSPAPISMETQV